MKKTDRPVGDVAADPINPREISPEEAAGLGVSLERFGDLSGIVWNRRNGLLVAGHQRWRELGAAGAATWTQESEDAGHVRHPKTGERFRIRIVDWDDEVHRAANLTANNPAIQGRFTSAAAEQLAALEGMVDYEALRLDALAETLAAEADPTEPGSGNTDPDAAAEPPANPTTKLGDLWVLGDHRLLCGDTTKPEDVARLMDSRILVMLSADPPYGMGKEADGIANDNLRNENLDAFQMQWWRAWLPNLRDNASAYIWGNAPDLWRLWYQGGLGADPDLIVRNEIVWDKGSGFGMKSEGGHSYPPASERCLFLMRGPQFLGNQNKDDFWEGYEPLRGWLEQERDRAGWKNGDVNELTGTSMAGHWFSKSQFMVISIEHYETLQKAADGRAFVEEYAALFDRLFPGIRDGWNGHRRDLAAKSRESRSYFDNAHDAMTDVWQFPRVHGEERFGHATPKPVAMVARELLSSSERGDVVGIPFGGTCPEIIAAEQHGRRCVIMEIDPGYCDVIVGRWEAFTGKTAHREDAPPTPPHSDPTIHPAGKRGSRRKR